MKCIVLRLVLIIHIAGMPSNCHLITLITCLAKCLSAVALTSAYHARLTESVSTENRDEEDRMASESGDELVLGDDSEAPKPKRDYSFRTLVKRFRRFLPYALPFKSRLAVCLTGNFSLYKV